MMGRFVAALEARDPCNADRVSPGRWRAHTVEAGRDLFGAWRVEVSFGRSGCRGRILIYVAADEAAARRRVRACLRRRATAPRRLGVAYVLRCLADPDGWSAGLPIGPAAAEVWAEITGTKAAA